MAATSDSDLEQAFSAHCSSLQQQLGEAIGAALEDSRGRTRLSRADFAVALIDEAEQAKYVRQRISVAY